MKPRVLSLLGFAVVFVAWAMPALALDHEGVPAKAGGATFKFGTQDLTYNFVEGGFKQVQGSTTATLIFKPEAKLKQSMHLNLTLTYQGPGKVALDGPFSLSGISMFGEDSVSRFTKGKSKCTITLTKATPNEVEGTADCPLLHDISGEEATPVTSAKFHATTR